VTTTDFSMKNRKIYITIKNTKKIEHLIFGGQTINYAQILVWGGGLESNLQSNFQNGTKLI